MTTESAAADRLTASTSLVQHLARAAAFPHRCEPIRIIETHISWVLLTGAFAYKIKKPVDLGFLDFSTLDRRHHFCLEELRLNRRFAPQLYLDVVPIGGPAEAPVIGALPALEWAVRMRQFGDAARLDHRLEANALGLEDLDELGRYVAAMHRAAQPAASTEAFGAPAAIAAPARDNFTALAALPALREGPASRRQCCEALRIWTEQACDRLTPVWQQRRESGRIRECHGDLHLANLVRLDDGIAAFDCLEFDPQLRWIDVVNDYAFTLMDLWRRGRADLAFAFLDSYLEGSGDYAGIELLPFYLIYRALIRAKIAAIEAAQRGAEPIAIDAYLDFAAKIAAPPAPLLLATHGLSGSGKSFVSARLVPRLPAIRLRSDVLRKRQAGLDPRAASGSAPGAGLYTEAATQKLYTQLRDYAAIILRAGFNVIVDATCLAAWQRALLREAATATGATFIVLDCDAPVSVLEQRVTQRAAAGTDASEADRMILHRQIAQREPLAASAADMTIAIDTAGSIDVDALLARLRDASAAPR